MDQIRTIELREHQTSSHRLSKRELARLLTAQQTVGISALQVGVRDPVQEIYDIRPGSVVGTLVWPDLRVLIRPKVNLRNIFFLLGFRGGLARWDEQSFPYARERDFLRALAWAFAAELRRALRYGIARDYITLEDGLSTIRGRIDIARQLSIHQDRLLPLECRFQEYTEDIVLNQVIKAALRRLATIPGLDLDLSRTIRQMAAVFRDVSEVAYPIHAVPRVTFTRLNRQWEAPTRLARLILSQESLKDELGTTQGTAFTVDMNKVFEKFVEEIVGSEARRNRLELEAQDRVKLTPKVSMTPDLILQLGSTRVAVGDTKYIEAESAEWPNANLYQLLAYCVALGLPRGLLIYASARPLEVQRVAAAGIDLEAIGIDLEAAPDELMRQANIAAQRLIDHARAQTDVATAQIA